MIVTELLLVSGAIICWLIIIYLAISVIQLQKRGMEHLQIQQQAWEKAQNIQKKHWQEQQTRDLSRLERALLAHIERLHIEEQRRLFREADRINYELAHLPYIEDTPLPLSSQLDIADLTYDQHQLARSLPHSFQGVNLSGHDLSYRYLRNADLSNTDLSQANLFMADLTGACLRGTKLVQADLSATNFSYADLTGADLTGANLLVTDLNDTILVGATLLHTRNLSSEQVQTAIVDHTTRLDSHIDITLPRIPRISIA
jgi:uncharacterized protein YjbI with pentapeptide repeats